MDGFTMVHLAAHVDPSHHCRDLLQIVLYSFLSHKWDRITCCDYDAPMHFIEGETGFLRIRSRNKANEPPRRIDIV